MRFCKTCGFPLGTRPGLIEVDGECQACINQRAKATIDFKERQEWLTRYIATNRHATCEYDCAVAVSGGKDSHAIVRRLFEVHGVRKALLITVTDEFEHTYAGKQNIENLVNRYNVDHIVIRFNPAEFKRNTLKDFTETLHPLKWIEEKIYKAPVELARGMGIPMVFFGENSAFEYGTSEKLEIFHPLSDETTDVIFMGAIWPYSISDSLQQAREIGFIDLDETGEWDRKGSIDQYTQIDSIGYLVQLWTKFPKFAFQRVADIACRKVREGLIDKAEARRLIEENDYILDPKSKADFCRCVGLTFCQFDEIVDKHANREIVEKVGGVWKVRPFPGGKADL